MQLNDCLFKELWHLLTASTQLDSSKLLWSLKQSVTSNIKWYMQSAVFKNINLRTLWFCICRLMAFVAQCHSQIKSSLAYLSFHLKPALICRKIIYILCSIFGL